MAGEPNIENSRVVLIGVSGTIAYYTSPGANTPYTWPVALAVPDDLLNDFERKLPPFLATKFIDARLERLKLSKKDYDFDVYVFNRKTKALIMVDCNESFVPHVSHFKSQSSDFEDTTEHNLEVRGE